LRTEVEQALQTLQQGQPDRLERALTLLQDTVFAFSTRVCGQRESAEDTMQETLLKAVRYLRAVAASNLEAAPTLPAGVGVARHGRPQQRGSRPRAGVRKGTVRVRLHRVRVYVRNELARAKSGARPRRKTAGQRPRSPIIWTARSMTASAKSSRSIWLRIQVE